MFPTPPELREEIHELGLGQSSASPSYFPMHNSANGECLCGCAQRPDNSSKILKIKILASVFLVITISLVGLNAYQRDAAQASHKNQPQGVVFENPAGAIQAAETTFPTMIPLNDTQPYQQAAMPVQMTPQMATPLSYSTYPQQSQYASYYQYPQQLYSPYMDTAYSNQIANCTNKIEHDMVGQRLKRFVSR